MAKYPRNPRRFSLTYTERESKIYVPMEYKLMERTGKKRKDVHLDALRFYSNYCLQDRQLQLI